MRRITEQYGCHAGSSVSQTCCLTATEVEKPIRQVYSLQPQLIDPHNEVSFRQWATWCGPCRLELPYVQKLREQMKDKKDVLILTLNTERVKAANRLMI